METYWAHWRCVLIVSGPRFLISRKNAYPTAASVSEHRLTVRRRQSRDAAVRPSIAARALAAIAGGGARPRRITGDFLIRLVASQANPAFDCAARPAVWLSELTMSQTLAFCCRGFFEAAAA